MSAPIDNVLAKLERVRDERGAFKALCPAHDDINPSLGIKEGDDGNVLLHCYAGCSTDRVVAAAGLTMSDLFPPDRKKSTSTPERRLVDTHDYVDEHGEILSQKLRFDPKDFRQRRPDGRGGWVYKLGDARRVLYNLPAVIAAVKAGEPVYIVEGEKDVETMRAAGYTATCNQSGAGKWSEIPDAAAILTGADIIVIPDKDAPGLAHARDVVASLHGKAATITVVETADGHKDISEHVGAGLAVEDLAIVAGTDPADPPLGDWLNASADAPTDGDGGIDDDERFGIEPIDLREVLAGDIEQPLPTVLRRDDRQALFYPAQINGAHGDSGSGKTWLALLAIAQQIRAGRNVAVIDAEDGPGSIIARLRLMGANDTEIAKHLDYYRPTEELTDLDVARIVERITERNTSLVVLDSLGELFGLAGIDENKDNEVGPWLRKVARRIADAGPAVLIIDHSTKSNDNPLYPSGSKRKRAAVGGASYLVKATKPLTAEHGGRVRIECAKDRHGQFARGEHVADLVLTVDPLTGGRWELYAPTSTQTTKTPTVLAARAVINLLSESHPMSQRALIAALRAEGSFKAGDTVIRDGIEWAILGGAITETAGPRNSRLFSFVRKLPEGAES